MCSSESNRRACVLRTCKLWLSERKEKTKLKFQLGRFLWKARVKNVLNFVACSRLSVSGDDQKKRAGGEWGLVERKERSFSRPFRTACRPPRLLLIVTTDQEPGKGWKFWNKRLYVSEGHHPEDHHFPFLKVVWYPKIW